jgi:hypothetical protein
MSDPFKEFMLQQRTNKRELVLDTSFTPLVIAHFHTGSSVICPLEVANDIDVVCLVHMGSIKRLKEIGFASCGAEYDDASFVALRKDDTNLICVFDTESYSKWRVFTEAAKMLVLKDKTQRIALSALIRSF